MPIENDTSNPPTLELLMAIMDRHLEMIAYQAKTLSKMAEVLVSIQKRIEQLEEKR